MSRYGVELIIEGKEEGALSILSSMEQALHRLERTAQQTSAKTASAMSSLGSGIGGALQVAAGTMLAGAATQVLDIGKNAIQAGIGFNALKENATIAFTTMLGSGEKAKGLLADIQSFASSTPFEMPELLKAAQSLAAFGVSADQVVPSLRRLGDISAGIGAPIGEIAEIYGKAKVQGRLFMEDINQLTGRGIPIIQELAKQFGVSESEVRKLVETGKVGFPNLERAFVSLTSQGGQFAGLTEKMSHSFTGMVSTLKDNLTQAAATFFEPLFNLATDGLEQLNGVLSSATFQEGLQNLAAQFANGLQQIISIVSDAIPRIQKFFGDFVNSDFARGLAGMWQEIVTTAQTTFDALVTTLNRDVIPAIQKIFPELQKLGELVGPVLRDAIVAFAKVIGTGLVQSFQQFAAQLKIFADSIEPAKKAFAGLLIAIEETGNKIKTALANIISTLANFANQFAAFIRGIASGLERLPFGKFADGASALRGLADNISQVSATMNDWASTLRTTSLGLADVHVGASNVAKGVGMATDGIKEGEAAAREGADANNQLAATYPNLADKASQAAETLAKVADKVRGMVEQALAPTSVDQRLQMVGDAWDEFRLRLDAINTGTPLDAYGQKFIDQVKAMQAATKLSLGDIAQKFKDFSGFADPKFLAAALESGAVNLEVVKERIKQQINEIVGQAALMKAAFNEVWASLSQQTKLDLANALGLTPQAANNAQQVFAAMSGTTATSAATQTDAAAKAVQTLQTGLGGARTNAGELATALEKLPKPLGDVKPKFEDVAKVLTDKLNNAVGTLSGHFKTSGDGVAKMIADLPKLNTQFDAFVTKIQVITDPLRTFLDDVLRPVADTLAEMLDTTLKLVDALQDLAEALKKTKPNEQFESHSPSPFEQTLKNVYDTMGNLITISPRLQQRLNDFGITTIQQMEAAWKRFQEEWTQYRDMTLPQAIHMANSMLGGNEATMVAAPAFAHSTSALTTNGQAEKRVVFSGPIHVHNPANFEAFMDEINRRVDTIVVNGD